jgi:hypothetical protein
MRKLARTLAIVVLSAGAAGMLATAPAMAATHSPQFRYPICNPSHPIYPCQNNF